MRPTKIAIIGAGKIARDQHVPALAANHAFELIAAASPDHELNQVRNYASLDALLDGSPEVKAVAICTPPQVRYQIASRALEHGCHVLLEKPPGTSTGEVAAMIELATRHGVALFSAWHSRCAAGVEPARQWLAGRRVRRIHVTWKEDVRQWHPRQAWIWKAGGLGVFDPGINALSILTQILPGTLVLRDAELAFPANCETPIAATLHFLYEQQASASMRLDFLYYGEPAWDIHIDTDDGEMQLSRGGAILSLNGTTVLSAGNVEYGKIYERFATLIAARRIDVDLRPFTLAMDALVLGRRIEVAPFVE